MLTISNKDLDLSELNKITTEWNMKAAKGECSWICADCSCSFPEGMPDQCLHGHEKCTQLIIRDKQEGLGNK